MKLVSTAVRPEFVGPVLDMLRTLGFRNYGVEQGISAGTDLRVEVLVKEVDAPRAAVALSRVTSKDPHPVFVTDVSPATLASA